MWATETASWAACCPRAVCCAPLLYGMACDNAYQLLNCEVMQQVLTSHKLINEFNLFFNNHIIVKLSGRPDHCVLTFPCATRFLNLS